MRTIPKVSLHHHLDSIGAFLSLACAIHCIAIPILVGILPLIGLSFFLNQTVEKVFVIASIVLAAVNLCWGYTIHKKIRILAMFFAAAVMVISGMFVLPHSHTFDHGGDAHNHALHTGHVHNAHLAPDPLLPPDLNESRPQSDPIGLLLLVSGGMAIALSHLLNRHFCKSCKNCNLSHPHS